jgi:BlaI family penicillinase repressor
MSNVSKIMESEYEIMKVLWAGSPLTTNEICTAVSGKKDWRKSTITTLINRLVEKGAVSSVKRGVYFYTPIITEAEYTQYHADNLLNKLFNGNAKNLLAFFCDNKNITMDDLDDLKEMIERKGGNSE